MNVVKRLILMSACVFQSVAEPAVTPPKRMAWDVIRSTDGDFAFSMPVRPARESREARGAAGPLEILTYSGAFEGSDYRLSRVQSTGKVHPDRVIAALARLRGRYLTESVHLVNETPIVNDGVIGEDLTYTFHSPRGDGIVTARTRHYISGHFYYAMTVTSPPGKPLPAAAARFLSSLTFEAIVTEERARTTAGPRANRRPNHPEARARVPVADATPEAALKTFVLAVAAGDGAALRAVAQPDAELARLLRRTPASPEALARMKARLDQIVMKRLKPGDTATMADGRSRTLRPVDIRAGRLVIWPEGASYATELQYVGGHWKVVASPFIAAREAADSESSRPPALEPRSRTSR